MPYQEGLLRVKLGALSQDEENKRREHFERAIQIFEKMGAVHNLTVAKEAAEKLHENGRLLRKERSQ